MNIPDFLEVLQTQIGEKKEFRFHEEIAELLINLPTSHELWGLLDRIKPKDFENIRIKGVTSGDIEVIRYNISKKVNKK